MWPFKGFLAGIHISTFLSTHQEWHALLEGFFDGFFPFIDKHPISPKLGWDLSKEHHYYRGGVIAGVIAAVWFWVGIWKVVT